MIERHVTFHLHPNREQEFIRFFKEEYSPAMAIMKGFTKADLLMPTDQEGALMMNLRFESLDDAAVWRESELHQKLKPKLKAFYQDSDLKAFELIAEIKNDD